MKKFEIRNSEGFTMYESNRLYNCLSFMNGCSDGSSLTIKDNRPELVTELNACSFELAKEIEAKGGINPSYEKLVSQIMDDPDNTWVDETDSVDLMNDYVSLQQHVLECLRNRRQVRKIIKAILSK